MNATADLARLPAATRPAVDAQLALGTVQFGLAYGLVGSGQRVSEAEATRILAAAARRGVHTLDTAAVYGDIEQRLAPLCDAAGAASARIVSKIAPLEALTSCASRVQAVADGVRLSAARLGPRLDALLFHCADDLLGPFGDQTWASAAQAVAALPWPVRLGVSCYSPQDLQHVARRFPVTVAQLPGNAFDQRLHQHRFPGIELHIRSVFLQGLLLADQATAARRLPAAAAALAQWHATCRRNGLDPVAAAIGVARSLPGVNRLVVGVETLAQFEAIATASDTVSALPWRTLACDALEVIDPRHWQRA
jgi:aryl-alcohol dehydrogenase-like predicted oxidoreductase